MPAKTEQVAVPKPATEPAPASAVVAATAEVSAPETATPTDVVAESTPVVDAVVAKPQAEPEPAKSEVVRAEPVVEATPADDVQVYQPALVPAAGPERTDPWAQLIADPGHAPELLALAAVQTLGTRAQDWVAQARASYPTADDAALARLAARQFTRFGGVAGVFGAVAGSYAPVALLGSAAVTHAELVLHLAAAYGLDPTDPQRAADLLVVARVHPTFEDAQEALAAARRPAYDDDSGFTDAVWRLGRMIAAQTGGWGLVRMANRYFPGTRLLAAVLTSNASAQSAAARADAYYRQKRSASRPG